MLPGKKIQDELEGLKKLVAKSYSYFKDNYDRFNNFRKFVYETSVTEQEIAVNDELGRPNLEFNVLTAYLSRMCGEFSKQEPSVEVSADEGENIDPQVIEVVEGHLRHILEDAKKSNTQYHTYRDSLSGGFCTLEVSTEYANDMSFKQVLKLKKAKYPTLCGYDPLATEPHKGDGNYSFMIYPKTKQDFEEEYDVSLDDLKFASSDSIGGFSWSFNNGQDDIVLLCKLFKKKKRKVKIMELADGSVKTERDYKKFLEDWKNSGRVEQAPVIRGKPRWTTQTTICRYLFNEKMVLEYVETDFNNSPLIFSDGDSIDLYDNQRGTIKQLTRPYCYNAKGGQQLKNLGGQCLAGYLENISQHKYVIKKEAIPLEKSYLNALTNPQKANTLVVNAFKDNNPSMPIPDPIIPIQPQMAPPEIMNSIQMADQIIQNELGSYDAQLGINDNQLSGVAIVEGATQSNAAAMPYVVNYMSALNQVAVMCVDLMPKYYKTPMTIPVIDREGNRRVIKLNQDGGVDFNFDSNLLKVKVSAGVNFAIQKSRALQQIIAMTQASPAFAQFMNSKGLKVLLDNFEIRGIDILKKLADEYQIEQKQMQQQQMQQQQQMMQNDPRMMDQHTKAFVAQSNAVLQEKELELKEQDLQMQRQTAEAEYQATMARTHAEEVRAQADEVRSNIDIAMRKADMAHQHGKDVVEMAHKVHGNDNQQ